MRADLHHLFTAEIPCNSYRSNYPFRSGLVLISTADINWPTFEIEKTRPGCGSLIQGVPKGFDPLHNRGVVARATLYFLVRYPGYITESVFPLDDLTEIVQWAIYEPISEWELHRNFEIFQVQGNRNPFIDYQHWAELIDFRNGFK